MNVKHVMLIASGSLYMCRLSICATHAHKISEWQRPLKRAVVNFLIKKKHKKSVSRDYKHKKEVTGKDFHTAAILNHSNNSV